MLLLPSPHHNNRPAPPLIDTIVVHSMHDNQPLSPVTTNLLPPSPDPYLTTCAEILANHQVSAHYLIGRYGALCQCVSEDLRAWHAGASCMPFEDDRREGVNDFSIGIELLTSPAQDFTEAQYLELANLINAICSRHPIRNIVGHDHIAPGRKSDPGPTFNWKHLKNLLNNPKLRFAPQTEI